MGNKTPGPESMDSVLRALQNNYGGVIQEILKYQPQVAQTQAQIDAATAPIYGASQVSEYGTTGRELNRIGSEIETANQLAASAREKEIADTYGTGLVESADKFQRILDPEFYKGREAVGKGVTDLLSSMDPTQLSGSERAEIERATARSGAVNPLSAAQTAANAMTFGTALQDKQARFGQAITQAASTLPATRVGSSGFEIATRRALTPNTGNVQFTGTPQNTGQNAWNTGNQFMQQATNLQSIKNQKQKDLLDQISQGAGAFSDVLGSFSFV